MNHRKRVPFTVVADNSLFTVYTFQAQCLNSASVKPKSDYLPKVSSERRYLLLHVGCENGVCIFLLLCRHSMDRVSDFSLSLGSAAFDDVKNCNFTDGSTFTDIFIQVSVTYMPHVSVE